MFPQYYALILTLKKSAPRVLAFLVGVMPVFLGFAYFGVAYFSTGSSLFSTVDTSAVALFALLNGDVIHDVFDAIYPISPVLSRIYLYTFISLFIYAVLNIFIAIVEDAFFAARQETEKEIKEDIGQQKFDIHDLDVVGLVAGPPLPLTGSMMRLDEDQRIDSLIMSSNGIQPSSRAASPILVGQSAASSSSSSSSESEEDDHSFIPPLPKTVKMKTNIKGKSVNNANELTAPLISKLRRSQFSRSARILIDAEQDPELAARQDRHEQFLRILTQLITSYNKQFLQEIRAILSSINTELRPPHNFDNYPCGFNDCIYCHLKTLLQSNLQTLRNNVAQSIEHCVNLQAKAHGGISSSGNIRGGLLSGYQAQFASQGSGNEEESHSHNK